MTAKPLTRSDNILVQDLKDEVLVYDLNVDKAFCLNETSALVWKLCDGRNTVSEISDKMSKKLKELVDEDLVWLALDQFSKDGLLENDETVVRHFAGVARREMLRKVGLASVIALPIISSIIAPNSVAATSHCAPMCFPAGQDVCAGCIGIAAFDGYAVGSGCTGAVLANNPAFNCTGPVIDPSFDIQRN